jgi:hypothetical protein
MNVKQLAGETEVLGENMAHYHLAHYKSHVSWPRMEVRPQMLGAGD